MPLLLLFLFSFVGSSNRSELQFRLRSEGNFQFRRETVESNVAYYVDQHFENTYNTRAKVPFPHTVPTEMVHRCLCAQNRKFQPNPHAAWSALFSSCPSKILRVEKDVDKYYLNHLMNKCRSQKMEQRQVKQEARCVRAALTITPLRAATRQHIRALTRRNVICGIMYSFTYFVSVLVYAFEQVV